jgi:hypothetical protein
MVRGCVSTHAYARSRAPTRHGTCPPYDTAPPPAETGIARYRKRLQDAFVYSKVADRSSGRLSAPASGGSMPFRRGRQGRHNGVRPGLGRCLDRCPPSHTYIQSHRTRDNAANWSSSTLAVASVTQSLRIM